jgi:hypothetical protein
LLAESTAPQLRGKNGGIASQSQIENLTGQGQTQHEKTVEMSYGCKELGSNYKALSRVPVIQDDQSVGMPPVAKYACDNHLPFSCKTFACQALQGYL